MTRKIKMIPINDISKWQGKADFRKMSLLSKGVILRSGVDSGSWEDRKFKGWRDEAEAMNFPYGNYWYYKNDVHPKRQAEYWAEIIGDRHGVLGCWLDLEDSLPGVYGGYKHWWDCVAYFKQLQPSAVLGIYTRATYFNESQWGVPRVHAFTNLPLWIAQYKTNKPDMPKGWTDWLIWQWTDEGDGYAHGVDSKEIDMNWYNGDLPSYKRTRLLATFGKITAQYQEA